jgi:hypothetical protein
MNRKRTYTLIAIALIAVIGAIYYYAYSDNNIPLKQRYINLFDEQPSISCSNIVLTAWNNNQLTVEDSLKIALNDILHNKGITSPVPQEQFDAIVNENDTQFKELFMRAGNTFYDHCEEVFLKFFSDCEEANSNHSDFLKCWVESSTSEEQRELYRSLTDNLVLPDVDAEPETLAPEDDKSND